MYLKLAKMTAFAVHIVIGLEDARYLVLLKESVGYSIIITDLLTLWILNI